ncbi:MAG: YmfQ family protein [Gorillibacterium sp.]|nr:YmfQ family protein [Gorillibacterium sp.]
MGYGKLIYGAEALYVTDPELESDRGLRKPDLMQYLPTYYDTSRVMFELQDSEAEEIRLLLDALDDILIQFFVDTATWGLTNWEFELGLTTDSSQSYVRRREMIKAKLRGAGTTTPEMIQRVSSAFSGGEVVVENVPGEYRFIVRFVGILGIPPNMPGLIQMIEEIKPAHLAYEFAYTYTIWAIVTALTWTQVKTMTWGQLKIYGGG